jgi:hypothetical protein
MANVVEVALVNCGVFTHWHTYDVKVAQVWYKRANGIPSPSNNYIDSQ